MKEIAKERASQLEISNFQSQTDKDAPPFSLIAGKRGVSPSFIALFRYLPEFLITCCSHTFTATS
jgi:hypothetical protein